MSEKVDVVLAVLAVMEEVGYVVKTGTMGSGNRQYTYAGESDLIRALRPALIKHSLTIFPTNVEMLLNEHYTTSGGSVMNRVVIRSTFVIRHQPSGTELSIQTMGEGADTGDKGVYKALTGAFKYALRQPFIIETGDDPDNQAPDGRQQHTNTQSSGSSTQKPTEKASTKTSKPTTEEKTGEQPPFDADLMNRAMGYKVPKDYPQAGKEFGKVMLDENMGPILLGFFSGKSPDGEGRYFEPTTDDEKKVHSAALYIFENNPTFKNVWNKYQESVK